MSARILLVSGLPPGRANVGEIALCEMTAGQPSGVVACVALIEDHYHHVPADSTTVAPIVLRRRPKERRERRLPGSLGAFTAFLDGWWRFEREVTAAVEDAAVLGRHHGVQKVWMVLDCATTLAMGNAVAQRLRKPLVSLVWDAPEYVLRQARLDRFTRRRLQARFAECMRRSERVAVVSEPMARMLEARYDARTLVVRTPAPDDIPVIPVVLPSPAEYTIVFAGSLHAGTAWRALLSALARLGWRLAGRPVRVRVLGTALRVDSIGPVVIEYLGFQTAAGRDEALCRADLLYLPMPFEEDLADLSRYSFPAKLSSYMWARRPIFVHAPSYAAAACFVESQPIGALCVSLDPERVAADLEAFANDRMRQGQAELTMARLVAGEFSRRQCRLRFSEFVGGSGGEAAPSPTALASTE